MPDEGHFEQVVYIPAMPAGVTCPQCGGSELRQITPGFFECETQVQVGAIPPGVHGNREYLPVPGPCGHRFQVGTGAGTEPCACGRDSIGACPDCGRRLCGLHGARSGEFLCADCIRKRNERVEHERQERFEAEVAVVRVCEPIVGAVPADTSGSPPSPSLGVPLSSIDRGLGEHSLWQKLWADGQEKGFDDLVGLTWNAGHGGDGEGECWQIVHHHVRIRQGMRRERGFLGRERWVEGMHPVCDCWTAYAFWPEVGRLCDVRLLCGSELSDSLTSLSNRAGGSVLHDLRWAAPMEPPGLPEHSLCPLALDDERGLFVQLTEQAESLGLETLAGLTWIDYQGRSCRIVDDAMVQANHGGMPTAYRAILIDKAEDGVTIDRELLRAGEIEPRIDEIGKELGSSLRAGEFALPGDPGVTG